jgi:hypothetical protein
MLIIFYLLFFQEKTTLNLVEERHLRLALLFLEQFHEALVPFAWC